jgi:ATP-dependent Lon protease
LRRVAVLPVRDTVLFPHAVLPLTVGRESSIQLIESMGEERAIVVVAQLDARLDSPQPADLHAVGTLATVHKVVRMPNQSRFVFTEGVERVRLVRYSQTEPFMVAEVETLEDAEPGATANVERESSSKLSLSLRRSPMNSGPSPPTSRTPAGLWILSPRRCPS